MKNIVITGGNKGLGIEQVRRFLESGCRVYVVSRTRGDLDGIEGDVLYKEADLGNWSDTSWLEEIHAECGHIDGLVNNAGMHLKKAMWDVTPEDLDLVLNINVKAMFAACGKLVEMQKDTGGAIVNISSMGGLMGLQTAAAYVTAKTAVLGITRSMAVDAAPFGFRTNAVCPGFIDTDMTRAILAKDPARRAKIEGRIPGGRFGTARNVANAIHFLISDEAEHINGVALPVDNGFSIGF
jgi:gluconate 5-dehydrogenase